MYYTIIKCGLWPPFIPAINGEAYCLSFVVHTVLSQVSAHSRESTHSRVSTHPPLFLHKCPSAHAAKLRFRGSEWGLIVD